MTLHSKKKILIFHFDMQGGGAEKLSGIGTLTKLIAKTASCEDMRCQAHITVAVQYQIRTGFPSAQSILSFYCLAFFIC